MKTERLVFTMDRAMITALRSPQKKFVIIRIREISVILAEKIYIVRFKAERFIPGCSICHAGLY